MKYKYYANNTLTAVRLIFGFTFDLTVGYLQFGDRQSKHNAWIAERLKRRYTESMGFFAHNLSTLKEVKAPHEYYRW